MATNNYLTEYQRLNTTDNIININENCMLDIPQWNHMEDSFFARVYQYHQHSGFWCKMVKEALDISIFQFIVGFTTFLFVGVNYDYFFKNNLPPGYDEHHKVLISDCIRSTNEMLENLKAWYILLFLFVSCIYFIYKIFCFIMDYTSFREIQKFYNVALGIKDADIKDFTWNEVQSLVMKVQIDQRMCIHKETLTELDIYHRILRYENYFIAMVNKNYIPLKLNIPVIGQVTFLTQALRNNINFVLFTCPYISPFINGRLKNEYKRVENRRDLAAHLRKYLALVALANALVCPFIFAYQLLYFVYRYGAFFKMKPYSIGHRRWSCFGEVSFRHYNELDHELLARLNRSDQKAVQYMESFDSPFKAIVAYYISFICGTIFSALTLLTIYDGDVIQVEYIISLIALMVVITTICQSFIPKENLDRCPEDLMTKILAEVHYLPESWKDRAHTSSVRKEFSKYFQLVFVRLLEGLFSPFATPYKLWFHMREKSLEIVDFLRNFTVEEQGAGDVCSYAQMDIRRHGSRNWHPRLPDIESGTEIEYPPPALTDNGRTELSLMHFSVTNPNWKPPKDSAAFLQQIRENAHKDFNELNVVQENNLGSINSLSLAGLGHMNITQRWLNSHDGKEESVRSRANRMEGSRYIPSHGILGSLVGAYETTTSSINFPHREQERKSLNYLLSPLQPQVRVAADMSISSLYMHDLHHKQSTAKDYPDQSRHFEQKQECLEQQQSTFDALSSSNLSESCYSFISPTPSLSPPVNENMHFPSHD